MGTEWQADQIAKHLAWLEKEGFISQLVKQDDYGISVNYLDPKAKIEYCMRFIAPHCIDASSIGYRTKGRKRWKEPIWSDAE